MGWLSVLVCMIVMTSYAQSACVSDCAGLDDGDYQSCTGCDVYVTCSNGLTSDRRPCPASLVWDDNKKICEMTSDTCSPPTSQGPPSLLTVNCDNVVEAVYLDGVPQPRVANHNNWGRVGYVEVPADTRVIAIHCSDAEFGNYYHGLIASLSEGDYDTGSDNGGWVCSGTPVPGWAEADFDDSDWSVPVVTGGNGQFPRRVALADMREAKYVWAGDDRSGVGNTYCRVRLD